MKTGILTLQYPDNYGAMLQAYSLSTFLCEFTNVEIINYLPDDYFKTYAIFNLKKVKYFKSRLIRLKSFRKYSGNHSLFKKFRKTNLNIGKSLSSNKAFSKYIKHFDFIVYGSDQIWNDDINGGSEIYYGADVVSKKRIAYAASFGKDNLTQFQYEMIDKYIKNNKGISCREKCADKNGVLLKSVCDPVFLLNKKKWDELTDLTSLKIDGDYIFYYALSSNSKLNDECKKILNDTGMKIYSIHPLNKVFFRESVMLNKVGPIEFLSLLKNAKYVITDSFHALCFSIIFGKQSIVVPPKDKGGRLKSLLELHEEYLKTENHYNFISPSKSFELVIKDSKEYLVNCFKN